MLSAAPSFWNSAEERIQDCYYLESYDILLPDYLTFPYSREGGTVLEVLSLLCFPFAWQSNKATLSSSITLSLYFCLALVHREPTLCQHFWSTCSSIWPTPILQHHFGASMHFLISFLSLATSLLHALDPIFHLNNLFFTNPLNALWPLSLNCCVPLTNLPTWMC